MDSAEQAALTPQSDNGQGVKYYNAQKLNVFGADGKPADGTRELMLHPNAHFEHLAVNTSISTVLVPANIDESGNWAVIPKRYCLISIHAYISEADVLGAIQWSEHLDPLFVNNYEGDPSLSWQFFGSSSGFLRRYPGMQLLQILFPVYSLRNLNRNSMASGRHLNSQRSTSKRTQCLWLSFVDVVCFSSNIT